MVMSNIKMPEITAVIKVPFNNFDYNFLFNVINNLTKRIKQNSEILVREVPHNYSALMHIFKMQSTYFYLRIVFQDSSLQR